MSAPFMPRQHRNQDGPHQQPNGNSAEDIQDEEGCFHGFVLSSRKSTAEMALLNNYNHKGSP